MILAELLEEKATLAARKDAAVAKAKAEAAKLNDKIAQAVALEKMGESLVGLTAKQRAEVLDKLKKGA